MVFGSDLPGYGYAMSFRKEIQRQYPESINHQLRY